MKNKHPIIALIIGAALTALCYFWLLSPKTVPYSWYLYVLIFIGGCLLYLVFAMQSAQEKEQKKVPAPEMTPSQKQASLAFSLALVLTFLAYYVTEIRSGWGLPFWVYILFFFAAAGTGYETLIKITADETISDAGKKLKTDVPQALSKKRFCSQCGEALEENAQFCSGCGRQVNNS